MQNMTVKIKIHSIVALITNSSTEIYSFYDSSVEVAKELVNEMLNAFTVGGVWNDYFTIELFIDIDYYYEYWYENFGGEEEEVPDILQLMGDIERGLIKKPEWMKCAEYSIPEECLMGNMISITALKPEYNALAEKIRALVMSPESREINN